MCCSSPVLQADVQTSHQACPNRKACLVTCLLETDLVEGLVSAELNNQICRLFGQEEKLAWFRCAKLHYVEGVL